MQHFLITRFNLTNKTWSSGKKEPINLTSDWLNNRFQLFETYCLPSVLNQTNKNFIWLVLYDTKTPASFLEKINSYNSKLSNYKPVFIDGFNGLTTGLKDEISKDLSNDSNFIITTRLDNDDAIHKDFVATIQQSFQPENGLLIDVVNGYQMTIKTELADVREMRLRFNPFMSLVEDKNDFETILSKSHNEFEKGKQKVKHIKKRLWLQVIHDSNKVNVEINYLKRILDFKFEDFGLVPKKFQHTNSEIQLLNRKSFLVRNLEILKSSLKDFIGN
ncbi:Putative rhamnosyl transferase [Flavobacteriaceae bacterium MAR_2010_188]|nr:Putative rhamnosyl transferase [Flavobacteriaceae bacterium MAR_2010_188]